jgi:hypothetical protein
MTSDFALRQIVTDFKVAARENDIQNTDKLVSELMKLLAL